MKHTSKQPPRPAAPPPGKQPVKKVKKKRRRRGNFTLYYLLIALTAIALGIGLSLTVFFKVEKVEVKGNTHYQEQALIDTAAIRTGENLFRLETDTIVQRVQTTYPYVEKAKVKRHLPDTAILEITEAVPLGYFLQEDGSYVLVSENGRVLALGSGTPPESFLQISGVEVPDAQLCGQLPADLSESMTMFRYLVQAVDETGFGDITSIDLSDRLNIRVTYQDRILIELGSEGDLVDKLDFARFAIDSDVPREFEGVMDVTIPGQLRYRPREIHSDPERRHPNLPTLEESEEEGGEGDASQLVKDPTDGTSSSDAASSAPGGTTG